MNFRIEGNQRPVSTQRAEGMTTARAGETSLDQVAKRLGVASEELRRLNPNVRPTEELHPGRAITIPRPEAAAAQAGASERAPAEKLKSADPRDARAREASPTETKDVAQAARNERPNEAAGSRSSRDATQAQTEGARAESRPHNEAAQTSYSSGRDKMVELDLRRSRVEGAKPQEAAAHTDQVSRSEPRKPLEPQAPVKQAFPPGRFHPPEQMPLREGHAAAQSEQAQRTSERPIAAEARPHPNAAASQAATEGTARPEQAQQAAEAEERQEAGRDTKRNEVHKR